MVTTTLKKNKTGTKNSKAPVKSIKLQISVWWDEEDECITLTMPGRRITTIDCKDGVRRGNARTHRHLFEHLARYLREYGRPAPQT